MLEAIDVCYDYDDTIVLDKVNVAVESGKLLHLCGNNGVGKTTLMKCLAGLKKPLAGEIHYQSKSINDDLVAFHDSLVYLGHQNGLSDSLTAHENCRFNLNVRYDEQQLNTLLQTMNLSAHANLPCAQLSAGQKKRVALCQLKLMNKTLWLLDEPLSALDAAGVNILMNWVSSHLGLGGMVVMTSHQAIPLDKQWIRQLTL